jgi:cytochrome d ubiquinol oxidase subunit II
VVAAIFLPLVLLYQGWTYHVFRARVGGDEVEAPPLAPASGGSGSA